MAFPKLLQKLFQNSGAGPLLNSEILPTEVVKSTEQTFTDEQKGQARENLGLPDFFTAIVEAVDAVKTEK